LKRQTNGPRDVPGYIATCPSAVQPILRKIRSTVRQAAPRAEEKLSYRRPAFFQNGVLIYFAAFKNHIGLFPPVKGDPRLERSLARYMGPKKNLKFPLDEPMPYHLIKRIVSLRVKQNAAKAAKKTR
jgi:uncharacterized protein YdhG (YjbR/CyaY superfamily)